MILVFDLDDTLYEEITFVKEGFKSVSLMLGNHLEEKTESIYNEFLKILNERGRGEIFDHFLKSKKIFKKKLLNECIKTYRYNNAKINLYSSASNFLSSNQNKSLYLVTDGNKNVQAHKIKLLKIKKWFKEIFITHRYGIKNAKPSLYCFEKIKEKERCSWEDLVYIGDNPSKDFVSLKKVNAKTIRILKGNYSKVIVPKEYNADYQINSIDELIEKIKIIFNK